MAKVKVTAKSSVGDIVVFTRGDVKASGIVLKLYERSVLVELFPKAAQELKVERTVVAHKNYEVAL